MKNLKLFLIFFVPWILVCESIKYIDQLSTIDAYIKGSMSMFLAIIVMMFFIFISNKNAKIS